MACNSVVYNWRSVDCVINGHSCAGFEDVDDAIVVEHGEDAVSLVKSLDRKGIFVLSEDHSAIITLKLLQGSDTDRFLNSIHARMRQGSPTVFTSSVFDANTGEGGTASCCMIMTAPNIQHGKSPTSREWKIIAQEWVINDYDMG